jgi:NAD(P)-dependent dehydrogenase (short-subunit alcohol dehydrogenase family)
MISEVPIRAMSFPLARGPCCGRHRRRPGVGRAFAKAFAATGAVAVIAERNGERGEAVAAEIAAGARHLDANSPRKMLKMLVGPGGLEPPTRPL